MTSPLELGVISVVFTFDDGTGEWSASTVAVNGLAGMGLAEAYEALTEEGRLEYSNRPGPG